MDENFTGRNWEFYCYPDSAIPNWREKLIEYRCTGAISPLHDCDIWEESDPKFDPDKYVVGELKKPHYHVVLSFGGKKSYKTIFEIVKSLQKDPEHVPFITYVNNLTGAIQYLDHTSAPLKHKYQHDLIENFGGFDFEKYFRISDEQEDELVNQILDFIDEYNIYGYKGLLDMLRMIDPFNEKYGEYQDMFRYVRKHTIFINAVLKDKRCTKLEKQEEI